MTVNEAYEKYKHLDEFIMDDEWLRGSDYKFAIIRDLWEIIRKQGKEAGR